MEQQLKQLGGRWQVGWDGVVVSTSSRRIFILLVFLFSGVICTSLECEQEDLTCLDLTPLRLSVWALWHCFGGKN